MRAGGARLGAVAFGFLAAAWPLGAQQRIEVEARDRRIEPELEPVYTVGAFDGEDWETFGDVGQVAFDAAGNLYVMDRHNRRVVVVDRNGSFVRQLGKAGEGPGEWRSPGGMGVLPDGTVAIADASHRAYLVYGPDGEYSHAVPMPGSGMITMGALQADPRGGAVFNGGGGGFTMRFSMGPGGETAAPTTRPIERITLGADGSVSTFYEAWLPPSEASDGERGTASFGGGARGIRMMGGGPRIFEPGLHAAVLPDGGMAVVDSSAWTVELVGPDGRVRSVITRDVEPVEVTDRIREREIERRLAEIESGEGPQMRVVMRGPGGQQQSLGQDQVREMQKEQLQSQGFYPEVPVVERLAASHAGTLWLERGTVNPPEPGSIDLFRPDGRYLGTIPADGIRIPSAFGPDGLVAYIERDAFDVPSIVVKRLPADLR